MALKNNYVINQLLQALKSHVTFTKSCCSMDIQYHSLAKQYSDIEQSSKINKSSLSNFNNNRGTQYPIKTSKIGSKL